jgi:hypothetical protein
VWSLVPSSETGWKQWTTKNGLGDNDVSAIASDQLGRLWVGHLNHGISVWNGASWKNYGALEGALGERIFDIEVCPTDGAVWIAIDLGLARYFPDDDTWSYFSRANGMPSDQVNALAFDFPGNIYCGTQFNSLTMARTGDAYRKWGNVLANTVMPSRATGEGLPSNVINDVLVTRGNAKGEGADVIYVSTIYGLEWSRDEAKTWKFVRGANWRANLAGRTQKSPPIDIDAVGRAVVRGLDDMPC